MKNHGFVKSALLASSGLVALASIVTTTPVFAQTSSEGVEQVVVTAEKRSENLQVVPIADSALTAEDLAEKHVANTYDLKYVVPALSEYTIVAGRTDYSIRGIGNETNDSPTADGGVGLYQDEVYIGRAFLANTDFLDVDRVEVLRGPQGTLFGRNAVGGAISFVSRAPTDDTQAGFDLSGGNYDSANLSGYASGKIMDDLDGKIAADIKTHDGYDTNTTTGAGMDDEHFWGISGALRWRPNNDLDATLNVDTSHRRGNGDWWVTTNDNFCNTTGVTTATFGLGGKNPACANYGTTEGGPINPNPRKGPQGYDNGVGNVDNTGGSLNIKWTNPLGLLTSITSYRTGQMDARTPAYGDMPEPLGFSCANSPTACPGYPQSSASDLITQSWPLSDAAYTPFYYDTARQYSQELRLSSDDSGPLQWLGGAYFYHEANSLATGAIWQFNFPGYSAYKGAGEGLEYTVGSTTSYALYGNVSYNITDALKVQAGVRWSQDDKKTWQQVFGESVNAAAWTVNNVTQYPSSAQHAAGCNGPGTHIYPTTSFTNTGQLCGPYWTGTGQTTFDNVSPSGTISYQFTPDVYTYATVSEGWKSGGFNNILNEETADTTPFKSENLTNYEIGAKTEWFDHRLLLNASLFYMEYKNFQVQSLVSLAGTVCSGSCDYESVVNAGTARSEGIELESEFRPTDAWDIYGNYSYNDAHIDNACILTTISGPCTNEAGWKLPFVPENKFTIGTSYTIPVAGIDVTPRVQYSYSEHYWSRESNFQAWINPYMSNLDASVLFAPDGSHWTFELWGKNLENHINSDYVFYQYNVTYRNIGAPLTYGATLHWNM